jgi:SAM-dependent methyltransferase
MLALADVPELRCPRCRSGLAYRGAVRSARLAEGLLECRGCRQNYEVRRGIARLYREEEVRGSDRLLRHVYDGLPGVHDPLVRFSFPLALGESEQESRARYLGRVGLERLAGEVAGAGRPARVLEVGCGTGSNVPLVRARVDGGVPLEVWAVDLSRGMLELCQQRMRFLGDAQTRLLAADAHALPFPDQMFDRVFHVGAVNGYRDPRAALAEMARVARRATPIVVVDERLDPSRSHGLFHRLFFRWVTIYDRDPHPPVEHLPPEATAVAVEQIGRFFYCMTFSMPPASHAAEAQAGPRDASAELAGREGLAQHGDEILRRGQLPVDLLPEDLEDPLDHRARVAEVVDARVRGDGHERVAQLLDGDPLHEGPVDVAG